MNNKGKLLFQLIAWKYSVKFFFLLLLLLLLLYACFNKRMFAENLQILL